MGIFQIGKNLSSDSLSSLSELDAAPLYLLIADLKKEIESKDQVLSGRQRYIGQLEQEVMVHQKELHRLKLREEKVDADRLNYEKRISNLQRALHDHDGTISALKEHNHELQQHLEDMKDTLQTYKESIRRLGEEKASLEEECKNQLITISNLRTALEETKRNGSSSVSFAPVLGGGDLTSSYHHHLEAAVASADPNSGQYFQPQHHYHTSNNHNTISSNNTSSNNSSGTTSYWSAFWRAMHDS